MLNSTYFRRVAHRQIVAHKEKQAANIATRPFVAEFAGRRFD
jgi:hypothetical protein